MLKNKNKNKAKQTNKLLEPFFFNSRHSELPIPSNSLSIKFSNIRIVRTKLVQNCISRKQLVYLALANHNILLNFIQYMACKKSTQNALETFCLQPGFLQTDTIGDKRVNCCSHWDAITVQCRRPYRSSYNL